MSWKATAHIKELSHAPSGEAITRSEKLLLLIIADYYNDEKQCAWASVQTIAGNALLTDRRVRQVIKTAEAKGVLLVTHKSGRSSIYRFPTLTPEIISPLKSEAPTPEISDRPLKPASPLPLKPASGEHTGVTTNLEPTGEHTQPWKTGVWSKHDLDTCRRYAMWLHKTKQGIKNPEGFAKTCYTTACDDKRIDEFLRDEAAGVQPVPLSGCLECGRLEPCSDDETICWLLAKAASRKEEGAA